MERSQLTETISPTIFYKIFFNLQHFFKVSPIISNLSFPTELFEIIFVTFIFVENFLKLFQHFLTEIFFMLFKTSPL